MEFQKLDHAVCIKGDKGLLYVQPLSDSILRCVYTKKETVLEPSSWIQKDLFPESLSWEGEAFPVHRYGTITEVGLGQVALQFDDKYGNCTWRMAKSRERIVRENGKELIPLEEEGFYRARLHFLFRPEEAIFGLGQGEDGVVNRRGQVTYLYPNNRMTPIPFLVSSQNYGILVDCSCAMVFQDNDAGSYLMLEAVEQLDYYLITGESFDELIAGYRSLTGRAAMLPRWAFGFLQGRRDYGSGQELEDVVTRYRRMGLPLDGVILGKSWDAGLFGEKKLGRQLFGMMGENIDNIHGKQVHALVSIWPSMGEETEDHKEMAASGALLSDGATYNALSEEARDLYFKQVKAGLLPAGFDGFSLEESEPFAGADGGAYKKEPYERYSLVTGEEKKCLPAKETSLYSLYHAKGIYEHLRREKPDQRVFLLSRAGYASMQSFGCVLTSGDIPSSWESMKRQVAEGLSMGLSGYPYWTHDIGGTYSAPNRKGEEPTWYGKGTFPQGNADKGFMELYVRWLQLGCFLPIMRAMGEDTAREIYSFGEGMFQEAMKKALRLRYQLLPYIYSLAGEVFLHHGTMMRALIFDFPEDEKAASCTDEYMFGPSFLVCPVTEPMYFGAGNKPVYRSKSYAVYLPSGCDWYDFFSGRRYKGGQSVYVDVNLDTFPLFVKAGSIIPMASDLHYATQVPEKPFELVVYAGCDGDYVFYDDAGDGYGYEKGEYREASYHWDEATATLSPRVYDMVVRVVK
ncbi:MAG: DUF5110 domain-containing protein [Blautia sp.]|nr:DUF5110 domain-containing protein [Blautia sp.]